MFCIACRWLGLSEQPHAIANWSVCRLHAAARSGWLGASVVAGVDASPVFEAAEHDLDLVDHPL